MERSVLCGIVTTLVPVPACKGPDALSEAAPAATGPEAQGDPLFNVASTIEIHFCGARLPTYVTAMFACCGSRFVALEPVIDRAGDPYVIDVTSGVGKVSLIPESAHEVSLVVPATEA